MPHPLEVQISQLARRWRRLLLGYGLGWLCACVLAAIGIVALADYLIRFQDRGIRTVASLVVLGVAGWAFLRFLWPAWRANTSPVQLAQRVEKRFPGLTDRLASTMYFLGQPDDSPGAGSAALRRAVVHQTEQDTAELDLNESLDPRPTRRALLAAAVAVGLAVVLTLAAPQFARVAVARLLRPWGNDIWPQRNHLAIRNPVTRIASGQNFEVEVVDVQGVKLPDQVWMEYRRTTLEGDVSVERQLAVPWGDALVGRQEAVTRAFEYRAVGGDDALMPWTAVEVLEPPAVETIAVQLEYPPYTGWQPRPGDKQVRALAGTRVGLAATVSKPLHSARLFRDGAEPVDLKLTADLHGFELAPQAEPGFVVEQTGSYWFELIDTDGLSGGIDTKYEVRATPDAPPNVAIDEPASDLHVTPRATIPLKITAKDDLAIASITRLVDRSDRSDQQSERLELYTGPRPAAAAAAAPPATAVAGEQRTVEQRWDLAALDLKPGTQLTVRAAASDYRPAEAISPPRRITIITPAELDERLAERQAFLAAELARHLKLEQDARHQVAALKIQLREVGQLSPADLDRLQNAEMSQRQITRGLSSKSDGLRAQVAGVLAELANNRVDQPDLAERMQSLAEDLDRLGRDPLPAIERELTAARKQAQAEAQAPSKEVAESLARAGAGQDEVVATLEQQLAELSRWDSYRQFHRDLAQIRRDQERVSEETAKLGRETLAKDATTLTPQERADLQKLGDEQQALGRRFERVERQMSEAASRLAGSEPATAETLADAAREARQAQLARQMGEAGKNVASNQVGQAVANQKQVLEQLGEMLDILANRQESSLARLVEKLKGAEAELNQMRQQQQGLRKKLAEAAKMADPGERRRELERLAKEERELAEKAQALARRLERLQASAAGRRTNRAASSLGKAGQAGAQGESQQASDAAQQAEQDLAEAQAEVARSRRQAELDLAFEQLAKIQDELAAVRARQQEVVGEAERLEGLRQREGRLSRGQAESVGELGREQRQIGADTDRLTEKLAAAEAFTLALRRASDEMARAAEHFDRQQTDLAAQQAARRALQRLELLLQALAADPGPGDQQPQGNDGESPSGGAGGSPGQPGDAIAEIAQLKLIKLMQEEVNARTRELDESVSKQQTLGPEAQQEYTRLSEEQSQLADLVRNLTPIVAEDVENDPLQLPDLRDDVGDPPPAEEQP